jgi:hypothetical protein
VEVNIHAACKAIVRAFFAKITPGCASQDAKAMEAAADKRKMATATTTTTKANAKAVPAAAIRGMSTCREAMYGGFWEHIISVYQH